jgi:hypothetical protein
VTKDRRLKQKIRAHMAAHGVNYTTARRAVLGETQTPMSKDRPLRSAPGDGGPDSDQSV